jgi:hypothetical protein
MGDFPDELWVLEVYELSINQLILWVSLGLATALLEFEENRKHL